MEQQRLQLQQIKQPRKVKMLILNEHNASPRDLYQIQHFTNLVKIDLSFNKLSRFPVGFSFRVFVRLRILMLHYNKFSNLKNLLVVSESTTVIYLTMFGNPLDQAKTRHFFVNQMPSLMLMDNKIVRVAEKYPDLAFDDASPVILDYPLFYLSANEGGQNSTNGNNIEQLLLSISLELHTVRETYYKCNPILRIQRWWRRKVSLKRNNINKTLFSSSRAPYTELIKSSYEQRDKQGRDLIAQSAVKIVSLFKMNYELWSLIRNLVSVGTLYALRSFCQANGILYEQSSSFYFLRSPNTHPLYQTSKAMLRKGFRRIHYECSHIVVRKIGKNHLQKRRNLQLFAKPKHQKKTSNQTLTVSLASKSLSAALLLKHKQYIDQYVQIKSDNKLQIIKRFYNKLIEYDKNIDFPFLFEHYLRRISAAVSIQRIWRGCMVRKQFNFYSFLNQKNAAVRIQKWIRNCRFIHRNHFLLEVRAMLKKESSKYIVLNLHTFGQIQQISDQILLSKRLLNIPFQETTFRIQLEDTAQQCKIVLQSDRSPAPKYFGLDLLCQSQVSHPADQAPLNVYDILVKYAKSIRTFTNHQGTKYVIFEYKSPREASIRKFVLALKTYRMKYSLFITSQLLIYNNFSHSTNLYETLSHIPMVNMYYQDPVQKDLFKVDDKSFNGRRVCEQLPWTVPVIAKEDIKIHKLRFYYGTKNYSCFLLVDYVKIAFSEPDEQKNLHTSREGYQLNQKQDNRYINCNSQRESRCNEEKHRPKHKPPKFPKRYYQQQKSLKISRQIIDFNHLGLHDKGEAVKTENYDSLVSEFSHRHNQRIFSKQLSFSKQSPQKQLKNTKQATQDYMKQRKEKIEEMKMIHHLQMAQNMLEKDYGLEKIRVRKLIEEEISHQKLQCNKLESLSKNKQKHRNIRGHLKTHGNANSDFEAKFLQMGNSTIKKQLEVFEYRNKKKKRDTSNIKLSVRQKPHRQLSARTQFVEIALDFNVNDDGKDDNHLELIEEIEKESRKLESKISQYSPIQQNKYRNEHTKALIKAVPGRVMSKHKKLIHSVFPQQFYAIEKEQRIKFQLPKLSK